MKTCPACSKQYTRRAKGGFCPHCSVELYVSVGGVVRLKEDKETVDAILDVLNDHLDRLSNQTRTFEVGENSRERKFAYDLLERTKVYLSKQNAAVSVTARDFLIGFLKYVLSIPWWSQNLRSLVQLNNRLPELVREYWAKLRNQLAQIQGQTRIMSQLPELELTYGL